MPEEQDLSQKTEEPTPRRLEEAVKKGQVISSKEVTNFLMLLAFTLLILWGAPSMMKLSVYKLTYFIQNPEQIIIGDNGINIIALAKKIILDFFLILLLPLLALVVMIIFSNFIQHGFILAPDAIQFDLSKVSILKGIERLFSLRSIVEFLKALCKLVLISIAIYITIKPELSNLLMIHTIEIISIMGEIQRLIIKMLITVCVVMAFIAALDYLYQRFEYFKKMRMSREEIKQEYKQTEGSPEIKSKLKSLRAERAKKRMMAAVPKADVIITNPTHYSVALKYDSISMSAPIVVAKGQDFIALKIREIARENFIPIIENPPLARALFDSVNLDEAIPYEHYRAVAEVISYIMKLKGRKRV